MSNEIEDNNNNQVEKVSTKIDDGLLKKLKPCCGKCELKIKDLSVAIKQWVRPSVEFDESETGSFAWNPTILEIDVSDGIPEKICDIWQKQGILERQPEFPGYFEDVYELIMFDGGEEITLANAFVQAIDMKFSDGINVESMVIAIGCKHCTTKYPQNAANVA